MRHARVLSLASTVFRRFAQNFSYRAQLVSAAGFWIKLLVLVSVSVCNIAVGATLYRWVSGKDWTSAIFTVYGLLYRAPGFVVTKERTITATVVLNTIFIFSIFVFAILVSMIGDEIKMQVKAVRTGNSELQLHSHLLILNWNSLTLPLLRQVATAQVDRQHDFWQMPVAVLADKSKVDMDSQLQQALKGMKLEVHTRMGKPYKQADLLRVSARSAKHIILLQPVACSTDNAAEAVKAATLVGLYSLQCYRKAKIVVQASHSAPQEVQYVDVLSDSGSAHTGSVQLVQLSDRSLLNR